MQFQKITNTYALPYTLRAEWYLYLIFTLIFGPIAGFFGYMTLTEPEAWPMLLVSLAFLSLFLAWVSRMRVTLLQDRLVYQTLFSKPKTVYYAAIQKIEVAVGVVASDNRRNAFYRYNIYDNGQYAAEPLFINMKPFSKRDLAILTDVIAAHVPGVQMDHLTRELYEGNFKPITTAGLHKVWQIVLWIGWFALAAQLARVLFRL